MLNSAKQNETDIHCGFNAEDLFNCSKDNNLNELNQINIARILKSKILFVLALLA